MHTHVKDRKVDSHPTKATPNYLPDQIFLSLLSMHFALCLAPFLVIVVVGAPFPGGRCQ